MLPNWRRTGFASYRLAVSRASVANRDDGKSQLHGMLDTGGLRLYLTHFRQQAVFRVQGLKIVRLGINASKVSPGGSKEDAAPPHDQGILLPTPIKSCRSDRIHLVAFEIHSCPAGAGAHYEKLKTQAVVPTGRTFSTRRLSHPSFRFLTSSLLSIEQCSNTFSTRTMCHPSTMRRSPSP